MVGTMEVDGLHVSQSDEFQIDLLPNAGHRYSYIIQSLKLP